MLVLLLRYCNLSPIQTGSKLRDLTEYILFPFGSRGTKCSSQSSQWNYCVGYFDSIALYVPIYVPLKEQRWSECKHPSIYPWVPSWALLRFAWCGGAVAAVLALFVQDTNNPPLCISPLAWMEEEKRGEERWRLQASFRPLPPSLFSPAFQIWVSIPLPSFPPSSFFHANHTQTRFCFLSLPPTITTEH